MQRIAMISEHASPLAVAGSIDSGGQNIHVAELSKQLARQGWLVDVFTRRDQAILPEVLHWQPGVRVIHLDAGPARAVAKEALLPFMAQFGAGLERWFAREHYLLAHAHFFMSGVAARAPAARRGLPLIMTFHALGRVRRLHQGDSDGFPDSRGDIESRLIRDADRVIAECPQDHEDLRTLYNAPAHKLDVVPCGCDLKQLHPEDMDEARLRLGWPRNAFCLLQLGRLVPRKGVDNVILAVAALKRRFRIEAQLFVVGGNSFHPSAEATPEIGRLSGLVEQHGLQGQVHFVGRRDQADLHHYYAAADAFVTTPWYEPFGMTPLEAMACARPVIGADVGGIRSTVVDGETGFLVPPHQPEQVAERLAILARTPALGLRLGQAGRRRVERHYSWKRVALEIAVVYQRAMNERLPKRLPHDLEQVA